MGARGFDCGTFHLVCCKRDGESGFAYKKEVNAFLEMPLDNRFVFNMMKNAGVPLIEQPEANLAYALGESAVNMAYTMTQIELKRPMKDGCLNPKERNAQQIMNVMCHSLIGEVEDDDTTLYYSVPANAINQETDADYHGKVLEAMFRSYRSEKGYKVDPHPINEALALVYAELAHKAWTGLGVSCLVPGTKIYTDNGIVDIESVSENDKVITHKGRWRNVNKVVTKPFKGTMTKIQVQGYSNDTEDYKFVDNHELYVKRNGSWMWIGCEEIVEGDIVGEPIVGPDSTASKITMTLCERTTCSKEYIKKSIGSTPSLQRLIGYFLGDGSLNEKEGCIQFDFANHEKKNIDDVQNIIRNIFSKESRLTKHGDGCTRVKCYSQALVRYFKNKIYDDQGCKKYPWDISRLNRNECLNLLVGMVRSDGAVLENAISFSNTNTRLTLLAKQLFSRIDLPASISWREPRNNEKGINGRPIIGNKREWSVTSAGKKVTKSIIEVFEEVDESNCITSQKTFIEDGFCCGYVQKIEHEEYDGVVYDLQVEEDHSFSGPYLTIHNCGAGMVNLCYAMYGAPIFQFSIVNSGDWIDKMASRAIGEETTTYVNREKMHADLTLENPDTLVQRAIKSQYEIMIQHTVQGIKKGVEEAGNKARSEQPIDIIIAGGTSMPKGFDVLFRKILDQAKITTMKIGEVIRPKDPLYSVARGCLIAAENAK
jgi:intein/homing endonuclease